MPLFDSDITGSGMADFGSSTTVNYALVHLTALGGFVREVDLADTDHVLRAGWFCFAHKEILDDLSERFYWDAPIFIDFVNFRWHTNPAVMASQDGFFYAAAVRWHLSAGTEGHLLVGP